MPTITKIQHNAQKERFYIHIDGEYCTSVRERTWPALGLDVGSTITCEELKEKENFFWKQKYGQKAWQQEKVRIGKVVDWVKEHFPDLRIDIKGFGADSIEMIPEHPEESGAADLRLSLRGLDEEIIEIEVTGTERMRGNDYWVRPDKIQFAKNHPDQDVWIALHFQLPEEKIVWIKPDLAKDYESTQRDIRGAGENYVSFNDEDDEVKSEQEVVEYIRSKIEELS